MFYIKTFIFEYRLRFISKHLYLNTDFVLYQNIYLCIQTKFYIKTFTFVFKQCFISKHLPLYSNKVLYQNIYLCVQTKFYIKTFTFVFKQSFISKHLPLCSNNVLYLNTKVNVLYLYSNKVLYQNIYLCIQIKFYIKTFTFVFKQSFISKHLPLYSDNVL